jgi:hypothetical protein
MNLKRAEGDPWRLGWLIDAVACGAVVARSAGPDPIRVLNTQIRGLPKKLPYINWVEARVWRNELLLHSMYMKL